MSFRGGVLLLNDWLGSNVVFCLFMNSNFTDCRSMEATIKHYQIKRKDSGQWYVAERHLFQSIPELIWYHQHNAAGKSETSGWESWGASPQRGSVSLVRHLTGPNIPVEMFKSRNTTCLLCNSPPHWCVFVFSSQVARRRLIFFFYISARLEKW